MFARPLGNGEGSSVNRIVSRFRKDFMALSMVDRAPKGQWNEDQKSRCIGDSSLKEHIDNIGAYDCTYICIYTYIE